MLRQMAIACHNHESTHGHFPTNGWGWWWSGDPDRGFGKSQPGGWMYVILPFIEQATLASLPGDGNPNSITTSQRDSTLLMIQTSLAHLNCPSRRQPTLYDKPVDGTFVAYNSANTPPTNRKVARADYAANMGTHWPSLGGEFPGPNLSTVPAHPNGPPYGDYNGVIFAGSTIRHGDIFDGTSSTYIIGEKYLNPDHYETGLASDDNENWTTGANNDNSRSGLYAPRKDQPGLSLVGNYIFGGSHAGGFQMAMSDGSVQFLPFTIDLVTH